MLRIALLVSILLCWVFPKHHWKSNFDELSPVHSPEEEKATFQLNDDLTVELVAAEPLVQSPVAIQFDADGRLWVVEMRGYMATIDAESENERNGRISVLEDTDADGRMDHSTVYLDSLIMPRALALVAGGVLVAENGALWFTKDTNNDLKADTKMLIDPNYTAGGLPEHAPNALWRGHDGWLYSAKGRIRYCFHQNRWQRDSTEFRGQWGMSHDDAGRLIYNYNWSQLHGDLVPPNYLSRNKNHKPTTGIDHGLTLDRRIYPIRPNRAVTRGYIPGTLDKDGRLLEFTSACSPFVYRGRLLPPHYWGNIFVAENAGNLVKRNVVSQNGFNITAYDPQPGREFMASTDERFRPVAFTSGPDGALYVADMYQGIVQHKAYMTPYLREQTLARKLDSPAHLGRIWRILPKNSSKPTPRKLSKVSQEELVATLSSADGWQRDMAQQLLIDNKHTEATAALKQLALEGKNPLGRMHALWTLHGLQRTSSDLLLSALKDPDPLVSNVALRLIEPMAKSDKNTQARLAVLLQNILPTAPLQQVLQMALSASVLDRPASHALLTDIITKYDTIPLLRDAVLSSLPHQEFIFLKKLWSLEIWQSRTPAREIFLEMLATAIARERNAAHISTLLAQIHQKKQVDWQEKAILTGLALGGNPSRPLPLANAPALLTTPRNEFNETQRAMLLAQFTWPGHAAVRRPSVAKQLLSPEDQKVFATGRQLYLSTCSGCHGTDGRGLSRFAPPLAGSEWVAGDEKKLALIMLHGMEGPLKVNNRLYDVPDILPVMPAHSTMDDGALTAILTYIRNEWGNQAGPVSKRLVGMTRITSQGRITPWTAKELEELEVK
ncbi:MAG: c-type cytochrome [Runella sp.]